MLLTNISNVVSMKHPPIWSPIRQIMMNLGKCNNSNELVQNFIKISAHIVSLQLSINRLMEAQHNGSINSSLKGINICSCAQISVTNVHVGVWVLYMINWMTDINYIPEWSDYSCYLYQFLTAMKGKTCCIDLRYHHC